MRRLYRHIAMSEDWQAKSVRNLYHGILRFSVPAPILVVRPLLAIFLALRTVYYFLVRIFVCEPLFKAYCKSYGENLKTGVFLHWVQGVGDIVLGDNVTVDGKSSFSFAARYAESPRLVVGDNTRIGHGNTFTIGQEIRIGSHVLFANNVTVFDVSGHPVDPTQRYLGFPSEIEKVRPVVIGDNVWLGTNSIILPGVTIGDNSVVAAGSVVRDSVPPNTVVSGNPAQVVKTLKPLDLEEIAAARAKQPH